jgi:hypothetical protein
MAPPDGFELKGFWGFADGSVGVAIVEADSASVLARATSPFVPWLRFSTTANPASGGISRDSPLKKILTGPPA